jgi:hypothetical protein
LAPSSIDAMGHKSTHVTETVYRHVIAPAIRGDATVMDSVFDTPMAPRARPLPGLVRPDVYVVAELTRGGDMSHGMVLGGDRQGGRAVL